jgi:hypothetical protein
MWNTADIDLPLFYLKERRERGAGIVLDNKVRMLTLQCVQSK